MVKPKLISRGAEATLEKMSIFGKNVMKKTRVEKGYRHPALDSRLRKERMAHEARMLHHVKTIGIRTPILFMADSHEMALYMEFIDAPRLKHTLKKNKKICERLCEELGRQIAQLHAHNIIHGDLTTSNVLVETKKEKPELVFIDFGLASISTKVEDKAVDLVNLKKTFEATHSDFPNGWELIVKGYLENGGKEAVLKQLKEVESRIRYA